MDLKPDPLRFAGKAIEDTLQISFEGRFTDPSINSSSHT